MPTTYSTYEAKTHFSEILRKVRSGESVLVSYHGRAVAEIRPVEEVQSFEQRLARMRAQGLIFPPNSSKPTPLHPVANRPGAFKRFLESRD